MSAVAERVEEITIEGLEMELLRYEMANNRSTEEVIGWLKAGDERARGIPDVMFWRGTYDMLMRLRQHQMLEAKKGSAGGPFFCVYA